MSSLVQAVRDRFFHSTGYLQGSTWGLPQNFTDVYGIFVAKLTRLLALPLPFISFLAVPFLGGTSTTISIVAFYLTWTAFVLSHSQITVELYGTLAARLLCYLLPALGFVIFDGFSPSFARSIKNRGTKQLPLAQFKRNKLIEVAAVAIFNVLSAIALEALLELLATQVFHIRSIFKVTSIVPLPWNILRDVAVGFIVRGVLIYFAHRYLLHTYDSQLKTWHLEWQHSARLPFSLLAAYDHPANYLLTQWLPTFLPAYLGRYHVLTWHLFVALCSLEELFIYSGYAILPSTIILLGMARRTDEHFHVVWEGKKAGNFGRWGLMDVLCGTACVNEDDALDDLQQEADKHQVKDRAQGAIDGAVAGFKSKTSKSRLIGGGGGKNQSQGKGSKAS